MDTREYVMLQIERARGQLRSAAFIKPGKGSLRLQGKTVSELLRDLALVGRRPVELIDAAGTAEQEEPLPGDIVSAAEAFDSDDGMVWNGTSICFRTETGAEVTPDQFEYLKLRPLTEAQIFATVEGVPTGVQSAWRRLCRTAAEARSDKAKDTLYLTVGGLRWEQRRSKSERRTVCSPLFMIPVREETTGKGVAKLKLMAGGFRQNGVLRREIQKEAAVNLYEGCDEEIPLEKLEETLQRVVETVRSYAGGMRVECERMCLCILDSQSEAVCQAVEKHIDSIVSAPLTQLLAGNNATPTARPIEAAPLYPLSADESQRRVIGRALAGESIYVSAPAGTGKSQTSVNIAANLVSHGKSVCIMSEKLAAGEVFLDYAARIGLDRYCLFLNSSMRTADIVRQIRSIVGNRARYVEANAAREALVRHSHAVEEYERLTGQLYTKLPGMQLSLYDLIACAVEHPALDELSPMQVSAANYDRARAALDALETEILSQMSDGEYEQYFLRATSGDTELDAMLDAALLTLAELGLNARQIILKNALTRDNAAKALRANLARRQALRIIGEKELEAVGNRRAAAVYQALVESDAEMRALHGSVMRQTLSLRMQEEGGGELLAVLEKLKVTKVTPSELFREYGAEILALCPIVVTTPTAAASYIYGTGLDHFDALLVDEASQMPIIAILPYMDRIKQLIVFGDHMQLGITSAFMKREVQTADTVKDTAPVDRSVLQAVQGRLSCCELTYHYRSHTEMLIHISNKTCYDGALQVAPDAYVSREALPSDRGLELIRVEEPETNGKGANLTEAREIASRVAAIRTERPDRSIGIIAFNEAQQDMICDMLEAELGSYTDGEMLWVRSLENAQGKEADFVFISIGHCRRTADGSLHKGISEINRTGGENRLNVLFTRARYKNFIVVSFDYRELTRSENPGVRRLHDYLAYAAEGQLNERAEGAVRDVDHAVTCRVAQLLSSRGEGLQVAPRIGTAAMAVDVALRRPAEDRYLLGLLLPAYAQSAAEAVTKLTVLEGAGWRVMPLSPIYFLTDPALMTHQLQSGVGRLRSFCGGEPPVFDTERRPEILFTAERLTEDAEREVEAMMSPITEDDFLAMDLENAYRAALPASLFDKGMGQLHALVKGGNTEAQLLLLIRLREKFFADSDRRTLLSQVTRLYVVEKEKKAGFLFAQLLRVDGTKGNAKLIKNLLKEALQLGIGGEYAG